MINVSNAESKAIGRSNARRFIPHDPAWLAKQQCYSCGQTGHLKSDCPLKAIISKERHGENKTSSSMSSKATQGKCNTNKDPLIIQLLRLPEISLQSHPKITHEAEDAEGKSDQPERYYKQGIEAWRDARKRKMNGSQAAVALGWRGKEAMEEYAKEIRTGRTVNDKLNDAMRWGSMCEDHAIATYISGMQCTEFKRTGLWVTSDKDGSRWLGVSPDGTCG